MARVLGHGANSWGTDRGCKGGAEAQRRCCVAGRGCLGNVGPSEQGSESERGQEAGTEDSFVACVCVTRRSDCIYVARCVCSVAWRGVSMSVSRIGCTYSGGWELT